MSLLIFFGLALASVYLISSYIFSYWTRKGIKQLEPAFFTGDAASLIAVKESIGVFFANLYNKHKKHRLIGVYLSYLPVVLVNDPELVQSIFIKDFHSFHDRPMPVDEEKDPISGHLFSLAGQKWRDMRVKLSPTFTSGKLKGMFSTIKNCGQVLEDYLVENVKEGTDVFEFRDLLARYSTNIISSVAFGIENDCINEPDHIFRKMGAKIFEPSFKNGVKNFFNLAMPKLFHKLNLRTTTRDVEDFLFSIVKQTVDHREKNNFTRNDFMQLLIQLKNDGFVSADKGEKVDGDDGLPINTKKLNIGEIVAQTFVFFVAGYETTSSTMSYCLFELARNPEALIKVQDEIDSIFQTLGPEGITYDALEKLTYLECCINETLRMYPPVPFLFRESRYDYKVPNSDIVIPKGTSVFIPTLGHQRDPDIFENPLQFKPERFLDSPTGNGNSKGLFYTPFGDGPRICIGMRMGKLTSKIGLALILRKFKLELTDEKLRHAELKFHPSQGILTPMEHFNLKVTAR